MEDFDVLSGHHWCVLYQSIMGISFLVCSIGGSVFAAVFAVVLEVALEVALIYW